jgi:hypothetical protein
MVSRLAIRREREREVAGLRSADDPSFDSSPGRALWKLRQPPRLGFARMAELLLVTLIVVGSMAVLTTLAWFLTDDRLFRGLLLFATLGSAWLLVQATGESLCNMQDPVGMNSPSCAEDPRYPLIGIPILLAIAAMSKLYRRSALLYCAAGATFLLSVIVPQAIR